MPAEISDELDEDDLEDYDEDWDEGDMEED